MFSEQNIDSPYVSDHLLQFKRFDLFDLDDLFLTFIRMETQGNMFYMTIVVMVNQPRKEYSYIFAYKLVNPYLVLVYRRDIFSIIIGYIHWVITHEPYNCGVKYWIVTTLWGLKLKV